MLAGLEIDGNPVMTAKDGVDRGVRLRDLNGDGVCEVIVSNPEQNAVFVWEETKRAVEPPILWPAGERIVSRFGGPRCGPPLRRHQ